MHHRVSFCFAFPCLSARYAPLCFAPGTVRIPIHVFLSGYFPLVGVMLGFSLVVVGSVTLRRYL